MRKHYFLLLLLVTVAITANAQVYVSKTATGANNGSSWQNAYTNLQTAINAASATSTIWVKEGTYYPSQQRVSGNTQTKSFIINKNLFIFGGFNGTETQLEQRNPEANVTLLSGDFNGDDLDTNGDGISDYNWEENAYTVVFTANLTNAQLDGFKIMGGNAVGDDTYMLGSEQISTGDGGGIYNLNSAIRLGNLKVIDNYASFGGGIYNSGGTPSITNSELNYNAAAYGAAVYNNWETIFTINNCDFFFNAFTGGTIGTVNWSVCKVNNSYIAYNNGEYGGGFYNKVSGNIILTNVKISNNTVTSSGGAIDNDGSTATLYNVLINNNSADYGGGIYNYDGYSKLTNVTITGNHALQYGGGMYNTLSPDNLNTRIYNSIVWNNFCPGNPSSATFYYSFFAHEDVHVKNSIIANSGGSTAWDTSFGDDDGGNFATDPLFTDAQNEDYTLQPESLGFDSSYNQFLSLPNGNNAWTVNDIDANGYIRLQGAGVDRGALEAGGAQLGTGAEPVKSYFSFNNPVKQGENLILSSQYDITNANTIVFDAQGKVVKSVNIGTNNTVSMKELQQGVYYCRITTADNTVTQTLKIIIE